MRLLDKSHMSFETNTFSGSLSTYPYPLFPFPLKNKPLLAHSPEAACLQILVPIWIFIIRAKAYQHQKLQSLGILF